MAHLLGLSGRVILGATGGGSGPLSIDGVVPSALVGVSVSRACALSDHEVIYQRCDATRCWLEVYDVDTGKVREVASEGANFLVAGAGVWAARGIGYFDSGGWRDPNRWPLAVDRATGEIYTSEGVELRRWGASGSTPLLHVPVLGASAYAGQWIASPAPDRLITSWAGEIVIPPTHNPTLGPSYLVAGNGPGGLVLIDLAQRRWTLLQAGNAFTPAIASTASGYRVASSRTAGEAPHDVQAHDVDFALTQCNGTRLFWRTFADVPREYPPIPSIHRPIWLGWFTFAGNAGLPANCDLPVALGQTRADVVGLDGEVIYRYVAGVPDGDLVALNQAVREERGRVPVLAYWTRGAQAAGVPDADVVGVEAYLGADETDAAFLARVTAACRRVGRAVLIANCYTSNTNNTSDLRRVPPLIAQLARDIPHVEGVLVFSGSGRAMGFQDHPEVHADWRQVFDGIPGAPVVLPQLPDTPDEGNNADTDTPPDPVVVPPVPDPGTPVPDPGTTRPPQPPPAPPAVVIRPDRPIGGSLFGDLWRALRRINFKRLFR